MLRIDKRVLLPVKMAVSSVPAVHREQRPFRCVAVLPCYSLYYYFHVFVQILLFQVILVADR